MERIHPKVEPQLQFPLDIFADLTNLSLIVDGILMAAIPIAKQPTLKIESAFLF